MSFLIRFFSEDIPFTLKNKTGCRKWLNAVILEEGKKGRDINYIFCSDEYLLELNKTYLQHNSFTDILTFPYPDDKKTLSGDIFISIERVKDNALIFHQDFENELKRVMVHGLLHLIGYSDHELQEKAVMTERENHYLEQFSQIK
jgi:probable rRNA maturation factor